MRNIEEIKAYNYGYGCLEDKLIALFRSGKPDFETADELIRLGADMNAEGKDDDENILSEILSGYWWSETGDEFCEDDDCEKENCEGCPQKKNLNPNCGEAMLEVIKYFLEHGFDVNKKDGRYGAQCLWSLTLSVFDRHIIDATKLLLAAVAKNISITSDPNGDETPWDFIGTEGSYQDTCCHDHHMGNIYEAVYQVYQAVEDGREYSGIDSYEEIYGKKVLKILSAKPSGDVAFFDMDLPESKHKNCFTQDLFFVTEDGILLTTQYVDFWFDRKLPDVETIDVSDYFPGIVGEIIKCFHYSHNEIRKGSTCYGQPIVTIEMDNGKALTFTINFGEVGKENRAAYFYFGWPEKSNE